MLPDNSSKQSVSSNCELSSHHAKILHGGCLHRGPHKPENCQNWGVGPWSGMGACTGQYGICRPPQFKSYRTTPSTIPPAQFPHPFWVITPLKPDLVLLHNEATVNELTCSTNTESNLSAARSRKRNKEAYGILFSDMANQGWTVDYETLEMGSLGQYQREMCPSIISIRPSQKANTGPPRPLCQSCDLMLLPHFPCKELSQLVTPFLVIILNPAL